MRALLRDAREFLDGMRFVQPNAVWLLLLPIVFALFTWCLSRRQRRRELQLGRAVPPRVRRGHLWELLAWTLFVFALAGPRWGRSDDAGVAVGRDVVVLLDFSRSMWADDMIAAKTPSRWRAAVAMLDELLDDFRQRGTGHRVSVILFAARPKLLAPLTTDFEHVQFRLRELDATIPPAEIRPADDLAVSGTRIGSALAAAVEAHDSRFPGTQEILLITDADDPADDAEWRNGVSLARAAKIPVHVVAVGDAQQDSFVLREGQVLEARGANGVPTPVQTRLQATTAKAIATEAQGQYREAGRAVVALAPWFRANIESPTVRELSEDRLPQARDRSRGFVLAALLFALLAWWRSRR